MPNLIDGNIPKTNLVVIEIGHRSPDPGAVWGSFQEHELNLNAGLECKRQLERHGLTTYLNRVQWEGIPLADFYARTTTMRAVAGVAFHWNYGAGEGFEVYTQTDARKVVESVRLSQSIADEMRSITILRPQAVRNFDTHPAQYGANITRLINGVPAPFAYCEFGFINNPTDQMRFNTVEKQRYYGVQTAKGILKYLGIAWIY
jgi:N-acetylmuramoyl-L-alanine amidase